MTTLTHTVDFTGAWESWTVPWHVPGTLIMSAVGGAGGSGLATNSEHRGGLGGNVVGILDSSLAGKKLWIAVGGKGSNPTSGSPGTGGWGPNAPGGDGATGTTGNHGAGGGAATEIRRSTTTGTLLAIAAGGGGGGDVDTNAGLNREGGRGGNQPFVTPSGADSARWGASAGVGGNAVVPGSSNQGKGGTGGTMSTGGTGGAAVGGQTAGASGAGSPGAGGIGGAATVGGNRSGGGGGGGGYYGGGGGGGGIYEGGGGGGGSSWADTSLITLDATVTFTVSGQVVFEWEYAPGTGCVPVAQTVSSATTGTRTFTYTGSNQSWVVPGHVPGSLRVMLGGGAGGSNGGTGTAAREAGGSGGYIRGALTAAIGSAVSLRLGGPGQNGFLAAAGVDWPHAAGGGGPRPGGWGGTLGSHSFDSTAIPRRSSGGGGGGSELWINGVLVAVAGGGSGGAIHAGTGFSSAYSGAAQTGTGGQSGGASTAHPGGNSGNDGFGGTTSGPGLGGGSASAKWPTYVEDGWPGSGAVGGAGASMIYVPGSPQGGSLCGGGSGGGGGYYGGGGGGGTYLIGTAGTGAGGSSWSDAGYIAEGTGLPAPVSSTATFTWTPITNGIYLTGDPDALDLWPNNAYIPGGLPVGSTLISQFVVELTATTTLTTAGSERLAVLDSTLGPTGSSLPGTWSGAAGSITTISGIDYYVLTNWTGSQTVTFNFTTPTRLDEFMAWVDRPLSGAVRIDGWCLYGANVNKVSVGMLVCN